VRATVYRPDVGGLLPVYVADRYDGVEARPFGELSEEEVEAYVARNVGAVAAVADRARPDVALANHLVMGPLILSRALGGRVPYAVKIHGSALEYTVKPHPRFLPAAREGLAGARGILVGSRHTAESLWAALEDDDVRARTRLGPPGVDVDRFAPRTPEAAAAGLADLRAQLEAASAQVGPADESSFARSTAEAATALATVDPARDRLIVFVGKLIASKGVELLLAAFPIVRARVPGARLLIVGFGALRPQLEEFAAALARGDLAAARSLRGEDGRELPQLAAFLDGMGAGAVAYRAAAAGMDGDIAWAGGSSTPSSPTCCRRRRHGHAEHVPGGVRDGRCRGGRVRRPARGRRALGDGRGRPALAAAVPPEVAPWLTFEVGPAAVEQLADGLSAWLAAPAPPGRRRARRSWASPASAIRGPAWRIP
jgi:hypothetical protein